MGCFKSELSYLCFYSQSGSANLRRSTRKRRINVNFVEFADSSGAEDEDLMVRFYNLSNIKYWVISLNSL